jgi:hypothetical protein
MRKNVGRKWGALFNTFLAGAVFAAIGAKFWLVNNQASYIIGCVFLMLGALLFLLYIWLYRILKNQSNTHEWLRPLDLLISAAIAALAIAIASADSVIWLAVMLLTGVYATWRLLKYARPYWRIYYFRVARDYFREIRKYRPNKI